MPNDGKYRITSPTIALFLEGVHHVTRTVPAGSIVTVTTEFHGNKLVSVTLDDKRAMMFTQDVRSRAEKVDNSK